MKPTWNLTPSLDGWDRRREGRWKAVLVSALVLLVGALVPSPLRRHPEFSPVGPDKLLHGLGHACLTMTLAEAIATENRDVVAASVSAVVCSILYGVVTGYCQRYIPGRVPERADLVAGGIGSVVGGFGWWYSSESAEGNAFER